MTETYVSVSAYNDADVLRGCLASVREEIPDAEILVVDGRYETWPSGEDNSTDETPEVAAEYGAGYVPAGPFEREVNKWRFRVYYAPDDIRTLFIDADERLIKWEPDELPEDRGVQPRIFNALVYSSTPISYWPRVFRPELVKEVNRWDAFIFDQPPVKSDAVTLYHRHDLREMEYRVAKYQRFRNEDRVGRYEKAEKRDAGALRRYLENDIEVDLSGPCPECGEESVVTSPYTTESEGPRFSRIRACLRDGCWNEEEWITVDEFQYVPNRIEEGIREDPERLRLELVSAGCGYLRETGPEYLRDTAPIVLAWARHHKDELREIA